MQNQAQNQNRNPNQNARLDDLTERPLSLQPVYDKRVRNAEFLALEIIGRTERMFGYRPHVIINTGDAGIIERLTDPPVAAQHYLVTRTGNTPATYEYTTNSARTITVLFPEIDARSVVERRGLETFWVRRNRGVPAIGRPEHEPKYTITRPANSGIEILNKTPNDFLKTESLWDFSAHDDRRLWDLLSEHVPGVGGFRGVPAPRRGGRDDEDMQRLRDYFDDLCRIGLAYRANFASLPPFVQQTMRENYRAVHDSLFTIRRELRQDEPSIHDDALTRATKSAANAAASLVDFFGGEHLDYHYVDVGVFCPRRPAVHLHTLTAKNPDLRDLQGLIVGDVLHIIVHDTSTGSANIPAGTSDSTAELSHGGLPKSISKSAAGCTVLASRSVAGTNQVRRENQELLRSGTFNVRGLTGETLTAVGTCVENKDSVERYVYHIVGTAATSEKLVRATWKTTQAVSAHKQQRLAARGEHHALEIRQSARASVARIDPMQDLGSTIKSLQRIAAGLCTKAGPNDGASTLRVVGNVVLDEFRNAIQQYERTLTEVKQAMPDIRHQRRATRIVDKEGFIMRRVLPHEENSKLASAVVDICEKFTNGAPNRDFTKPP